MYLNSFARIAGRLAAVSVMAVALLPGVVGSAAAEEGEFEAPDNILNTDLSPKCITVTFTHSSSGVARFTVDRLGPNGAGTTLEPHQLKAPPFCDLEPGRTYRFKVCAVFATEDEDEACTEADLGTAAAIPEAPPQGPKPTPQIVASNSGPDWIDFKWEAGVEYEHYYLFVNPGPGTIPHMDDGTWGYWRVNDLKPNTTYNVSVQGCTTSDLPFVEDTCHGKSAPFPITTKPYPLHSGADTCRPGLVWREAFDGDTVCVDPRRRDAVKKDNATAASRLAEGGNCTPPNCTFTTGDACKSPFVWREARPEDHVCVTVAERTLVGQENAAANSNRAQPR